MSTSTIWSPGCTPTSSAPVQLATMRIRQEYIATSSQTLFTLTEFTYVPATQSLEVWKNGLLLPVSAITESVSGTTFSLAACSSGDVIIAEGYISQVDGPTVIAPDTATPADLSSVLVLLLETGSAGTLTVEQGLEALGITDVAQAINTAPSKPVPATLDKFGLVQATDGALMSVNYTELRSVLRTYFDSVYLQSATSSEFTGVVKHYVGAILPAGYVWASGRTIGSAASGATERASIDCQSLYTMLWDSMSDAAAPVIGGRGLSASADWSANKPITLPDLRGRVVATKDNLGYSTAGRITTTGAGFDGTTLGASGGAESHALVVAELASHNHTATLPYTSAFGSIAGYTYPMSNTGTIDPMQVTVANTGSGTAHTSTQPTIILNTIIKL